MRPHLVAIVAMLRFTRALVSPGLRAPVRAAPAAALRPFAARRAVRRGARATTRLRSTTEEHTAPIPIELEAELSESFMKYAMSTILGRALPDARDGLKPVHRRILFAMRELNLTPGTPYRKCARVVGEVLGKFHPHGDNSVYDALVRMAQDFVMSARLVDGHGNFGSVDADPPAAMRYTECKLTKFAHEALLNGDDLGKAARGEPLAGGISVAFSDNFDASEMEPDVLPARVPVLLVNGAAGIAVGMATSIPPHNLGEVCDAALVVARAAKRGAKASDDELSVALPAPDFPTGGLIMGTTGVARAYATGQGSIVIRAKTHFEKVRSGRNAIVATELPYLVTKSELLAKTADAINARRIEGIADLRDESGREGTRVVFELKRDAQAEIVLSNLFKSTRLQTSFPANIVAVDHALNDDGDDVRSPVRMTLRYALERWLGFRFDCVRLRAAHSERRAAARLHIVEGLCLATANVDAVVALIRASDAPADAKAKLVEGGAIPAMGALSEDQAAAVLALTLSRLTTLEADKLDSERTDLEAKLEVLRKLMSEDAAVYDAVVDEVAAIKKAYPTPRRSEIVFDGDAELRDEDVIENARSAVLVAREGYVKRTSLEEFGAQSRGGRGRNALQGGTLRHLVTCHDHDTLLSGREKGANFPTSKAPRSAGFHSFRLIFGRAIIPRSALEAWMLSLERARAENLH